MARHTLLRAAGLTVTAVGAALGAGAGVAQAGQAGDLDPTAALRSTAATAEHLPLNPLANTGVDPLDNGVGTQVADFKAVNTRSLTGSLASAPDLPVAGPLLGGLLPG
ncbi:hypothetical protein ACWCXB_27805 [Streptomyces sp. NPDC001514]